MKKIIFLLFVSFLLYADSTFVDIAHVFTKRNGKITLYRSVYKAIDLNLIFTELQGDSLAKDSLWIYYGLHNFWPESDSAETYSVRRVGMANVYDTLGVEWFDNETWRGAFDDLNY